MKPKDFGDISPIGSKRESKNTIIDKKFLPSNKGYSSSRQPKHKFYIPIAAIDPSKLKSTPKSKDGLVIVNWNGSL